MQITEVLVGSWRGEGERIALVSIECRRLLEDVVGGADAVWDIVLIGPGHRGARLHRQRGWREGKVVYRHHGRRVLSPGQQHSCCQRRADDRTEDRTTDNRTQHLFLLSLLELVVTQP